MQGFVDDWEGERIDRERCMLIPYVRIKQDIKNVMAQICSFVAIEPTEELLEGVKGYAQSQPSYRSGHRYTLEEFGLDKNEIQKRCAFFQPYWDV